MPDSLISQFQRQFNSPIETDRSVANLTALNAISSLRRWRGMMVYVVSEDMTYVLQGGTDNTFWTPLTGIADAPSDGMVYGRSNGSWQIIDSAQTEDSGTSGISATGAGSGSFTISSQSWWWVRIGDVVNFYLTWSGSSSSISGGVVVSVPLSFPEVDLPSEFTVSLSGSGLSDRAELKCVNPGGRSFVISGRAALNSTAYTNINVASSSSGVVCAISGSYKAV